MMTPFKTQPWLGAILYLMIIGAPQSRAETKAREPMSESGKQIMMQMIADHARCSAFYDAFDRELRRRPEVENSERAAMLIQVHLKVASAASMNLDDVKDPNQFAYDQVRHQGRLLTEESRAEEDIGDFMQTNLDFCMDLMNELKEHLDK